MAPISKRAKNEAASLWQERSAHWSQNGAYYAPYAEELIVDKASSDWGTVTKEVSFADWALANPKAIVKGYFTA